MYGKLETPTAHEKELKAHLKSDYSDSVALQVVSTRRNKGTKLHDSYIGACDLPLLSQLLE